MRALAALALAFWLPIPAASAGVCIQPPDPATCFCPAVPADRAPTYALVAVTEADGVPRIEAVYTTEGAADVGWVVGDRVEDLRTGWGEGHQLLAYAEDSYRDGTHHWAWSVVDDGALLRAVSYASDPCDTYALSVDDAVDLVLFEGDYAACLDEARVRLGVEAPTRCGADSAEEGGNGGGSGPAGWALALLLASGWIARRRRLT